MFYDKDVMNSERFGNLWKLAHGVNVSDENLENENLPDICEDLDYRITSESNRAHRRLSLRASAHLLSGGANMYKRKINNLYDDVNKLNEDIIWRRKRIYNNSSSSSESSSSSVSVPIPEGMKEQADTIDVGSSESNGSSESMAIPEEMRRAKTIEFDTSFSPAKKKKFDMLSKRNTPEMSTLNKSPIDISSTDIEYQESRETLSSNDISSLQPENIDRPSERRSGSNKSNSDIYTKNTMEESISMPSPTMLNKETQTTNTLVHGNLPNITSFSAEGFKPNLPFAYIVIHDNIATRVPSKIIISSITYNLNSIH